MVLFGRVVLILVIGVGVLVGVGVLMGLIIIGVGCVVFELIG